jgi:aryl-alcohol dehydrogenase-like predicted oxidoreductase
VWICVSQEKLGRSTLSRIREKMGYGEYTGKVPEIMFAMDQLIAEGRIRKVGHGVWEVVAA